MTTREEFLDYFTSHFDCNYEILENKLNNFSIECFNIYTDLTNIKAPPEIELSYFQEGKHALIAVYFVTCKNEQFIYVRKFRNVKDFKFHFYIFKENKDELFTNFDLEYFVLKDFSEMFEYFIGDAELFGDMVSIQLLKLYKTNDDIFFDFQLFLEFYLLNSTLQPHQIKGKLIPNYDSEIYLTYLNKPVRSNSDFGVNNVAGLFSAAFERIYYFSNQNFVEIFFAALTKYSNPLIIYKNIFNFFDNKHQLFFKRPYSQLVLTNFNYAFMTINHSLGKMPDNSFQKFPDNIKIIKTTFIHLANLFNLKNKNYYSILKLKNELINMNSEFKCFRLNDEENTPENKLIIHDKLIDLEKYFNNKFLLSNILINYFNNQKLYFI